MSCSAWEMHDQKWPQSALNVLQGNSSQLYSAITLKSKTKGNETNFYVYEMFLFFFKNSAREINSIITHIA